MGTAPPVDPIGAVAKWLLVFGGLAIVAGLAILALRKIPGLGKLPLDIVFERRGFGFYFPLGTCIIASLVLTGILWLIARFKR